MHAGSHAYIRVNNGVFVDDNCNEFTFSGYNTWEAVESAVNVCCGGYDALAGQFLAAGRDPNLSRTILHALLSSCPATKQANSLIC